MIYSIFISTEDVDTLEYSLPPHSRCSSHTLNLVASVDAKAAITSSPLYRKISRSAFGKITELWNKQNRSSQAADIIQNELKRRLIVPTVTRWNSDFDAIQCVVQITDNREGLMGLNRICDKLSVPKLTNSKWFISIILLLLAFMRNFLTIFLKLSFQMKLPFSKNTQK